jgi:NADPH-dependent 2,4-dienoyl-CoA reductase/sulfur reductase-like enzyme/nitrite reductase/ring-hydroxylating ferredoxin subunit
MGAPLPLTGPDLAAGVPVASVPDGGFVRGHAFGEALLLSRRGDAFTAMGAACTHYGAPLDEGLQVDGTIRCPWHHACFDLRTGEAVRAPALRALPRYAVAVEAGQVRVTGPLEASEAPRRRKGGPESVVIVGNGAAASAAVETLRNEGYDGPITMIGREPGPPVDRPNLSKDYLAGNAPEEWLDVRDAGFYDAQRIERIEATVAQLDPRERRVVLADGRSVPYGACLLATGCDPIRLPVPGGDRPNVFTLRNLADSRAIIAAAASAKSAVVLGASFIGLEVAASLRARGVKVHVAAPESVPLERILGREIGAFLRVLHEEHGVVFHLGATAKAIGDRVLLSDGAAIDADLVVMGVGVRPNVALAEKAGLAVDNGVLVDEGLQTSVPGIWAAGDIARWPDPHTGERQRIEHWVLAQRHGQTAARNILGAAERFDGVPFFWSAHYDVTVNRVGFAGGERIDCIGSLKDRNAVFAWRRGDKTLSVATIGADAACLEAEKLLERDDHEALARLVPGF